MEILAITNDGQLALTNQIRIVAKFRAAGDVLSPFMLKKLSKAAS
jgi:hypothetical protein